MILIIFFYKAQNHLTEKIFPFFNPEYLESVKVFSLRNLVVQSAK